MLKEWMQSLSDIPPWQYAPILMRRMLVAVSTKIIDGYTKYLRLDETLGPFTVAEYDQVWKQILAYGLYMQGAHLLGCKDLETTFPRVRKVDFVEWLSAESEVGHAQVQEMVDLLVVDTDRCPDGALGIFAQIDESIIPMSSLIVPTSPHRNIIARLQLDPSRFGRVGELLGRAGEEALSQLLRERMDPSVRVATRVPVRRGDGTPAGDLDVVLFAPDELLVVVCELKWGIEVDGNVEVMRAEWALSEKVKRTESLRKGIISGDLVVQWPKSWPVAQGCEWRWAVLSRDVLPTRLNRAKGVPVSSYQLLSYSLPKGATAEALWERITVPPIPPASIRTRRWDRIHFGDLRIEIETVA